MRAAVIAFEGSINPTLTLSITIAILVINYLAVARVINQAGYSPLYMVIPLAPFGFLIASVVVLYRDLHGLDFGGRYLFLGINNIGILWELFWISLLANWVIFLFFAFTRWPAGTPTTPRAPRSSRRSKAEPELRGFSPAEVAAARPSKRFGAGGPGFATNAAAGPATRSDAPEVTTTAPVPTSSVRAVALKHCVWCGEALPGSRALFHDCGPTDRVPVFCATCGSTLNAESARCDTCEVVTLPVESRP
jgi:hypothetical protein